MVTRRKTAIITGASRGLGKAMAKRIAADGANVIVNYYPGLDEEAQGVVNEILADKGQATAIAADVSSYADVEKMVKRTVEEYGSVDILVNNAAVYRSGLVHRVDLSDWDLVVNTALTGTFYCTRAAVPYMLENKYGRIVNISSGSGLHGFQGDSIYSAAKAGIIGFTKALTKELSKQGILSNVVVPGLIMTDLTAGLPQKSIDTMKGMIPMRELGKPEDVAKAVSFLVLNNDYISGDILCVDGGLNS